MKRRTIVLIATAVLVPLTLILLVRAALFEDVSPRETPPATAEVTSEPVPPTPVSTTPGTVPPTTVPTTPGTVPPTTVPATPQGLPFDPLEIVRSARNRFLAGPAGLYSDNGRRRIDLNTEGWSFTPYVRGEPYPEGRLDLRLLHIHVGDRSLYDASTDEGSGPSLLDDDIAVYLRSGEYPAGDIREEYYALDFALEQVIVFPEPLPQGGELVLDYAFSSTLPLDISAETILFSIGDNLEQVYGEALVRDAAGRELPLNLSLTKGQLRLIVPADWLVEAAYPVRVVATLGTRLELAADASDQVRPVVASSDVRSRNFRYMVVWADNREGSWGVYGQLVVEDGTLNGTSFRIGDGAHGDQQSPAIVYDPATNRYLVAWEDSRDIGTRGVDIYVQLVNADGSSYKKAFPISDGTGDQVEPAVATRIEQGRTRFLVTWTDHGHDAEGDIRGRLVQFDGSLGYAVDIAAGEDLAERASQAAYDADSGHWLVVWEEGDSDSDIAGQWLNQDGSQLLGERVGICTAAGGQGAPALIYNSIAGQFLVVWEDQRGGGWDIYGQRLDGRGLIGDDGLVNAAVGSQRYPDVSYNDDLNVYLVAWQEGTSAIRAQQVSNAGEIMMDPYTVAVGQYERGRPALAFNQNNYNQYLVVWQQSSTMAESFDDIYGRRLDGSLFVDDQDGNRAQPAVAHNRDDNEYLIVWQRDGDIYGRRISPSGTWQGDEIAICDTAGEQISPAVAYDVAHNSYLIIWEEEQPTPNLDNGDIYGREVRADGSLPGNILDIRVEAGAQERPALAYDAATARYLVAWQDDGKIDGCLVDPSAQPPVWACFTDIAEQEGEASSPAVAANPRTSAAASRFLVVWQHQRDVDGKQFFEVHGRFVQEDGTKIGAAGVLLSGAKYRYHPAAAYDPKTAQYLVVVPRHDVFKQHLLSGCLVSSEGQAGEPIFITDGQNYVYRDGRPGVAVQEGVFWITWGAQAGNRVWAASLNAEDGTVGRRVIVLGPETIWDSGPPRIACDGDNRCLVVHGIRGQRLYAEFLFR